MKQKTITAISVVLLNQHTLLPYSQYLHFDVHEMLYKSRKLRRRWKNRHKSRLKYRRDFRRDYERQLKETEWEKRKWELKSNRKKGRKKKERKKERKKKKERGKLKLNATEMLFHLMFMIVIDLQKENITFYKKNATPLFTQYITLDS